MILNGLGKSDIKLILEKKIWFKLKIYGAIYSKKKKNICCENYYCWVLYHSHRISYFCIWWFIENFQLEQIKLVSYYSSQDFNLNKTVLTTNSTGVSDCDVRISCYLLLIAEIHSLEVKRFSADFHFPQMFVLFNRFFHESLTACTLLQSSWSLPR